MANLFANTSTMAVSRERDREKRRNLCSVTYLKTMHVPNCSNSTMWCSDIDDVSTGIYDYYRNSVAAIKPNRMHYCPYHRRRCRNPRRYFESENTMDSAAHYYFVSCDVRHLRHHRHHCPSPYYIRANLCTIATNRIWDLLPNYCIPMHDLVECPHWCRRHRHQHQSIDWMHKMLFANYNCSRAHCECRFLVQSHYDWLVRAPSATTNDYFRHDVADADGADDDIDDGAVWLECYDDGSPPMDAADGNYDDSRLHCKRMVRTCSAVDCDDGQSYWHDYCHRVVAAVSVYVDATTSMTATMYWCDKSFWSSHSNGSASDYCVYQSMWSYSFDCSANRPIWNVISMLIWSMPLIWMIDYDYYWWIYWCDCCQLCVGIFYLASAAWAMCCEMVDETMLNDAQRMPAMESIRCQFLIRSVEERERENDVLNFGLTEMKRETNKIFRRENRILSSIFTSDQRNVCVSVHSHFAIWIRSARLPNENITNKH